MIEAVAERFKAAPRQFRRRWSAEFNAQAVAEALEPGASVLVIAHRIGIHPSQLFGKRCTTHTLSVDLDLVAGQRYARSGHCGHL